MYARPNITSHYLLTLFVLVVTGASLAQAATPKLNLILPRGGQRGTEITLNLHGLRLGDSLALILDDAAFTVTDLKIVNDKHTQVTLAIAPDCRPGLHGIRVRTATGISNLKLFSVGALPEVVEAEPNNTPLQAQSIAINTTINGIANNEDVDYYVFEATKGQRITAEIEGMRLGDFLFDPFVAIANESGFELAACDDSALLRQDAFVTVIIPEDGRYFVQVRESSYAGNGNCRYRLHVGSFPRPVAIFPAGGRPGETINVRLIGQPDAQEISLKLPGLEEAIPTSGGWIIPGATGVFLTDEHGIAPSPNWLRLSDLDNAYEVEPNHALKDATVFETPLALNGIIEKPRDRDCYRFVATKGQVLDLSVYARRLRSPLDPVLTVHDGAGKYLKGNDDSGGPDSFLRFKVPADGEYVLIIRDHLHKGGPDYVYRIEVAPVRPSITVTAPRLEQSVAVPVGGRAAIMLTAQRADFGGPLELSAMDLPPGVTMQVAPVNKNVSRIPVVFSASADAQLAHSQTRFSIAHADPSRGIVGGYRQDVEMTLGRNNVVFRAQTVDRLPVGVTVAAPFSIEAIAPQAPMVRSGSMRLKIIAVRAEGFDGPIRLRVPFVPPGVGASNSIVIKKGQTEAYIPLNANGKAHLGQWQLVVTASGNAPGGGVISTCSQLTAITIAEPFVAFQPQATSMEQGKVASMYFVVQKQEGFEGTAKVQLRGLPHKVTADSLELTSEMEDLTFTLTSKPDSPPGVYKNIFCIATFQKHGEPVVHRLPAGELRIEKPLPPEVAPAPPVTPAPPKPEAKPEPQEKKAKPLTRLEKLRRAHEARRKQDQSGEPQDAGASP